MSMRERSVELDAAIRSAASRIPRQYLALVLAELLDRAHRVWTFHDPEDWRFAWSVAQLRAWAVGQGSLRSVKRITASARAEDSPFLSGSWESELTEDAQVAAGTALVRSLEAVVVGPAAELAVAAVESILSASADRAERAAEREAEAWSDALDALEDELEPDVATPEWFELAEAEERAHGVVASARRQALERSIEDSLTLVQALVPPQPPTDAWRVRGELIISGEVVLRLDGWRLVDAVRMDELVGLEGERSVAFDACLERAGVCKFT